MRLQRSPSKGIALSNGFALGNTLLKLTLAGLAVVSFVAGEASSASSQVRIFRAPPSPAALADIIERPRYRSIVLNPDESMPSAGVFGLMINFEFDSTRILPESRPLLASVGEMLHLKRIQHRTIVIEGHTDATGSAQYNQHLSKRRALAIKRYLVERYGVDPSRLSVVGFGERQLHDRSQPASGVNRRVQFRAEAQART